MEKTKILICCILFLVLSSIVYARDFEEIRDTKYGRDGVVSLVNDFKSLLSPPHSYVALAQGSADPQIPPLALLQEANGFKQISEIRKDYEFSSPEVPGANIPPQPGIANPEDENALLTTNSTTSTTIIEDAINSLEIEIQDGTSTPNLIFKFDSANGGWMWHKGSDSLSRIDQTDVNKVSTSDWYKQILSNLKAEPLDYKNGIEVLSRSVGTKPSGVFNLFTSPKIVIKKPGSADIQIPIGTSEQSLSYFSDIALGKNVVLSGSNVPLSGKYSNGLSGSQLEVALDPYIKTISQQYNIEPALVKAIIKQETNWHYDKVGTCGEAGLTQLLPITAIATGNLKIPEYGVGSCNNCKSNASYVVNDKHYACNSCQESNCNKDPSADERFDPEKAILTTVKYLDENKKYLRSHNIPINNLNLAASYNGGPGAINSNGAITISVMNYASSVMNYYQEYLDKEQGSSEQLSRIDTYYLKDPPNFAYRLRPSSIKINYVVLHHTGGPTAKGAIDSFKTSRLSVNYVVDKDGTIYKLMDDKYYADHIKGDSELNGVRLKPQSLGIEIVNTGNKKDKFTEEQYNSIRYLLNQFTLTYSLPQDNNHIVGHYEVDTGGKWDPSPNFDWNKIGLSDHRKLFASLDECKSSSNGFDLSTGFTCDNVYGVA